MTDSLMTVMLVDDHSVVRTGYRMLLEMTSDFSVVSEVETGDAAVDQYNLWRPNVVVMDLNLPGISGIEATRRIIQIDGDAKVLVFSIHDESIYVTRSFDAGASGYLCKSCSPGEMVEAVRTVASGKLFTGSSLSCIGQTSGLREMIPCGPYLSESLKYFSFWGGDTTHEKSPRPWASPRKRSRTT